MYDSTTTVAVGLDVHARSVRLAAVRADELLEERTLPYDEEVIERALRRWPGVRCCYEAGPTGFGLYRHLVERGIGCQVVAPGLVPQRPGDRVKTDPRDARKLARLLAGGLLEAIHVPSRELEAARDLVRAREDARLDRMRDRHRLSKFCLRHGRTLPTSSWTVVRRKWLSQQRFQFAAQQITFDTYVHAVDLVDARIEALERSISQTAEQEPWRQLVARLRCLRGVDTLTALALVTEIGDFSRYESAERFMAFVGLVPSERSSGEQRRPGSITKVGNAHVRRLLIESAWHARRRPTVGYQLARRQRGQDATVVEQAWRCQQRLYQRWQRMAGRGKPQPKIVVACARELAGFIWAIATEQPLRST
jgi:transposase